MRHLPTLRYGRGLRGVRYQTDILHEKLNTICKGSKHEPEKGD